MTAEVKEEKFGSRPSKLEPVLRNNKIDYMKNIFVVTCRARFNKNRKTRYLIIKEFNSIDKLKEGKPILECMAKYLKESMKDRVIGVYIDERDKMAYILHNNNTDLTKFSFNEFREYLLKKVRCGFISSSAKGSKEASPLSRFFRQNLGKSVSITDVDFFLPQMGIFVEEKTYIKKENEEIYGLLGWGQCLSYKEIAEDIVKDAILLLVFVDNDNFYIKNVTHNIDCKNTVRHERWGTMVKFRMDKELSIQEFLSFLLDGGN